MKATELNEMFGLPTNTITNWVREGKVKGSKIIVTDHSIPGGYYWDVETPVEEVRALVDKRIIRYRKANQPLPLKTLPLNKDLFNTHEAAAAAGVSATTVHNFLRDKKITAMRNGRQQYVSRDVVEQLREKYRRPEPVTVAPRVQIPVATSGSELAEIRKRLGPIETTLKALETFLVRFAASCGYKE